MVRLSRVFNKNVVIIYAICIGGYIIVRYILQVFTNHIFRNDFPGWWWVYFVNSMFYVMTILCGCAVGCFIRKQTIFHSSLVTTLGVLLCTFLTKTKITDYSLFFSGLVVGAILGAIGGGCVFIVKKIWRSRNRI